MSPETLLPDDPHPGVRSIRMTRAAAMNTLTLELLRELERKSTAPSMTACGS